MKQRRDYDMGTGGRLKVGIIFSLLAGLLNLLFSNSLSWAFYAFPRTLIILSGVLLVVISIFMLTDRKHHVIWGVFILFSAILGFIALGIGRVEERILLWPGIFILVLGVVGGALGIAQE